MGITLLSLCVAIGIIAYFFYQDWKRRRLIFKMVERRALNDQGAVWGMPRNKGECDEAYRERLRNAITNYYNQRRRG